YMLYHFAHKASREQSYTQIQSDISILDDIFTLEDPDQTDLEELTEYLRGNSQGTIEYGNASN
ncbi:hypothetical protein GWI33_013079, partial [Rhynchophorus ferrugineus]